MPKITGTLDENSLLSAKTYLENMERGLYKDACILGLNAGLINEVIETAITASQIKILKEVVLEDFPDLAPIILPALMFK